MNIQDLQNLLKQEFNKFDDLHIERKIENVVSEINGSYDTIEDMQWDADGKYQSGEGIFSISVDNETFYAEVTQMRTGSYHTDFYYQDACLQSLLTQSEYEAPTPLYSFEFKNKIITFKTDNLAYVGDTQFSTVEKAIDSILN